MHSLVGDGLPCFLSSIAAEELPKKKNNLLMSAEHKRSLADNTACFCRDGLIVTRDSRNHLNGGKKTTIATESLL